MENLEGSEMLVAKFEERLKSKKGQGNRIEVRVDQYTDTGRRRQRGRGRGRGQPRGKRRRKA